MGLIMRCYYKFGCMKLITPRAWHCARGKVISRVIVVVVVSIKIAIFRDVGI